MIINVIAGTVTEKIVPDMAWKKIIRARLSISLCFPGDTRKFNRRGTSLRYSDTLPAEQEP